MIARKGRSLFWIQASSESVRKSGKPGSTGSRHSNLDHQRSVRAIINHNEGRFIPFVLQDSGRTGIDGGRLVPHPKIVVTFSGDPFHFTFPVSDLLYLVPLPFRGRKSPTCHPPQLGASRFFTLVPEPGSPYPAFHGLFDRASVTGRSPSDTGMGHTGPSLPQGPEKIGPSFLSTPTDRTGTSRTQLPVVQGNPV